MRATALAFAMLLYALPAGAANYYMAPTGSDSNPGTLDKPWKSYTRAQNTLKAGDTLFARGGTYLKCAGGCSRGWKRSGTSAAPITFRNYPGETPVFDGGRGTSGAQGYFLILQNISYLNVIGLKMTKWCSQWGDGIVQFEGDTHHIDINGNNFDDNGCDQLDHHVYVEEGPSHDNKIRNNHFGKVSGAAIHFYHAPTGYNYDIYNNFFNVNAGQSASASYPAVILRHEAKNIKIRHNTFVNSPIDAGGSTVDNIQVYNNVAYCDARMPCLEKWSSAEVFEGNNVWYATDGSPFDGHSKSTTKGNIYTNPLLESLTSHKLSTSSPAIDKANPTWAAGIGNDYDGQNRPMGAAADMGADEVR
jgi:hypothetical protein